MFLNTIRAVLNDNWPVLVIFIVTLVSMRFFYLRAHKEKGAFYKEFFGILSIVYLFLLFQLLTKVELNEGSGYNLVPFTEIFRYKVGSSLFIYNVVGNILAFVIFGLIVSIYIKPKTVMAPFLISLVVSSTVEFVQLNIGRSFDVDDIILNVLGCVIGYLLYIGLAAIHNHLPKALQKEGLINIICFILDCRCRRYHISFHTYHKSVEEIYKFKRSERRKEGNGKIAWRSVKGKQNQMSDDAGICSRSTWSEPPVCFKMGKRNKRPKYIKSHCTCKAL